METYELKAILMAIMAPKMSARGINDQELSWLKTSADKIIEEARTGGENNAG